MLGRLSSRPLTWNERSALVLFDQSAQSVGILIGFLPESPLKGEFKSTSPSTISSIARNVMDNYLTISYLLHQHPEETRTLVKLVWEQFVDKQRYEILNTLNPSSVHLPGLQKAIEDRTRLIESDPYFPKLDKNISNNCKLGISDKIVSRNDILQYLQIVPNLFWATNNHFSQYVHSTAYAADQLEALGEAPNEALSFLITIIKDLQGLFSLSTLSVLYGFGIKSDDVPLNVLDMLLFWQDFFRGTNEERFRGRH